MKSPMKKKSRISISTFMLILWSVLVLVYLVAFSNTFWDELSVLVNYSPVKKQLEVHRDPAADVELDRLLSEVDGPVGVPKLPKETKYPDLLEAPDSSYPPYTNLYEVKQSSHFALNSKWFAFFSFLSSTFFMIYFFSKPCCMKGCK